MRESEVHKYLVKRIESLGGEVRRVEWIGRRYAPDILILLPLRHAFCEEKRPGEEPTTGQLREHRRLRLAGFEVLVIDSCELVDYYFPQPN